MNKHTATPYFLGEEYPGSYVSDLMMDGGHWTEINAKDHSGFAFIVTGMSYEDSRDDATCKATAEFIVRCANSHDALVSELQLAGKIIRTMLSALPPQAKSEIAQKLELDGTSPDGMTRHHERAAVLAAAGATQ